MREALTNMYTCRVIGKTMRPLPCRSAPGRGLTGGPDCGLAGGPKNQPFISRSWFHPRGACGQLTFGFGENHTTFVPPWKMRDWRKEARASTSF